MNAAFGIGAEERIAGLGLSFLRKLAFKSFHLAIAHFDAVELVRLVGLGTPEENALAVSQRVVNLDALHEKEVFPELTGIRPLRQRRKVADQGIPYA